MFRLRFVFPALLIAVISISAASAQEKIELRLRGAVGDRYLVTVATDDKWTEVYEDEKSEKRLQTRAVAEMEGLEPRKDGALRLKITFRQMAVTDNSDGEITRYDSTRDAKSSGPMATIFNAMIGQSLIAVMNDKGRILNIEGAGKFLNDIIAALKLPAAEQRQLKEILKDSFSAEAMAQATGVVWFPDKAVAVGDTWQRKLTRKEEDYSVQVAQTSTLKSTDNDTMTIETSEKITADPKTKTIRRNDGESKYAMNGQSKSIIRMDKNTGQSLFQTTEQRLAGKFIFNYKTREGAKVFSDTINYPVYSKSTMQVWARKLTPKEIDAAQIAR